MNCARPQAEDRKDSHRRPHPLSNTEVSRLAVKLGLSEIVCRRRGNGDGEIDTVLVIWVVPEVRGARYHEKVSRFQSSALVTRQDEINFSREDNLVVDGVGG